MKSIQCFLIGSLVLFSQTSFAEYFCISDQGKPKHCNGGDIILVQPTMMPRVCDFEYQILRMPKGDNKAEYLCRYTGQILGVKELKSRSQPQPAPNNMNQRKMMKSQPQRKKRDNNMFDKMPFFK